MRATCKECLYVTYSFINLYFKLLTRELPQAEDLRENNKEKFLILLEQICIFGEQLY